MRNSKRSAMALMATAASLALALSACGSDSDGDDNAGSDVDCSAFEQYGDLDGKTVTVYTSIVTPEDQPQIDSYKPFEECTGAKIEYEGSKEFETQLPIRLKSGNAPDLAYIPQPGLLQSIVADFPDVIVPASEGTVKNVDEYFTEAWKGYGSVDGTFYAAPLGANVKSFVWYSPKAFDEAGYEIPTTWDELIDLSDQIVEDGGTPWCAGIFSDAATGWPVTDWLEDLVLRTAGPETYDQWLNHEIPFDDPAIVTALGEVGKVLRNPDYVNGGLGDVRSIATTTFQDGGLPILDGLCSLHRQASFYQANWPEGTDISEDGDVYAFYLPGESADDRPLLGGGEFVAAFSDRPEVQAFQAYLASPEWANEKAKVTPAGWVSANNGLDPENLKSPIDKLSAELLSDPESEFRFDASDLMPAEVGTGTFWKEMTAWIAEGKSDKDALAAIEQSWP